MEYCAEVAVFQSACALADSLYSGGLKEFHGCGHDSERVRKIVCHAVAEITYGLTADITRSQADHWSLMLTVLSTWKTISCVPELNAVLPVSDLMADFILPLPEWNFTFFYDIIKHNKWIRQFLQVTDSMPKTAGIIFIQLTLSHLRDSAFSALDSGDIQIMTGILEYFGVIENKHMPYLSSVDNYEAGGLKNEDNAKSCAVAGPSDAGAQSSFSASRMSSTQQDASVFIRNGQRILRVLMCDEKFVNKGNYVGTKERSNNGCAVDMEDEKRLEEMYLERHTIIEILQKFLEEMVSIDLSKFTCVADATRLLIAVLNLTNVVAGGEVVVIKNHCLFESYSLWPQIREPVFQSASRSLNRLGDVGIDRLITLNIVKSPLQNLESPGLSDLLLNGCLACFHGISIAFSEHLSQICDYLCQTTDVTDVTSVLVISPVLCLDCYRRIFLNASKCLVSYISELGIQNLQDSMQSLSDLCVSRLSQCVRSLDSRKDEPAQVFERSLVIIEQNFLGGKEHFDWLVETDCIEVMQDPRWLKCLEDYWEDFLVLKAKGVNSLLSALKKLRKHLYEEYLNRLQKLILKVYHRLSLDEQTDVLELLYGGSGPSPFNVDRGDDFAEQLLNAHSKLMTSDVQHLEDTDVMNDFSCLVFQQPLETLEKLTSVAVRNKQHVEVVAKVLLQLPVLTMLENENVNIVVFENISHWLWLAETVRDEERNAIALCRCLLKSGLNDRYLRLTQKFLQSCILSHGSHLVMKLDSESNLLSADLTLELISVVCESLAAHKRDWPSLVSQSLLDSLCVLPLILWLCQMIDSCRNLWLTRDQHCLQKAVLKEKAVMALNSLLETAVSCEDEIPSTRIHWFSQQLSRLHWTIPHYVRPLLHSGSGCHLLSFPEPLDRVLQGSRDGSIILELSELVLLLDFCRISETSLELVLNAVALPDIVMKSCQNFYSKVTISVAQILLNSVLCEWFRIGQVLKRLLQDYFVRHDIHVFTELAICQVFIDAVLLIKESAPEYSKEKFLSVWQHLTNTFAAYFKNAILPSNTPQTVDRVQFAKLGIGLVIRFICVAPKAVTQPLDILVADIISGLRTDSLAVTEIHAAFAEVDCVVDMEMSKAILNQIVM